MLALRVTVPVASFRKGFAREYWETEDLPPPATCYGFLLSLVGERNRRRHIGVRIAPALLPLDDRARKDRDPWPERSTVLRTLWRVKSFPLGSPGNTRPDFQELLTNVQLAIWLDSTEESREAPSLEDRVHDALDHPERIERSGGLCLGESTHLVDEVERLKSQFPQPVKVFLLNETGRLSLPVWVDHVGSSGTRFVTGDLDLFNGSEPDRSLMARIEPH